MSPSDNETSKARPSSRRRLRFSIRAILFATTLVALCWSYCIYCFNEAGVEADIANQVDHLDAASSIRCETIVPAAVARLLNRYFPDFSRENKYLFCNIVEVKIFGESQTDGATITDHDVEFLSRCPHLSAITIYGTNISDKGLDFLCKDAPCLQAIHVNDTRITEEELKRLKRTHPHVELTRE